MLFVLAVPDDLVTTMELLQKVSCGLWGSFLTAVPLTAGSCYCSAEKPSPFWALGFAFKKQMQLSHPD